MAFRMLSCSQQCVKCCCVQVYAELTPKPIAAASLGQVYKGKLKSGETVAVKVQRPYVVETVSIDLFIIRQAPVSCS